MLPYTQFEELVAREASKFLELDRKRKITIISHLDADGLSSASILISALRKLDWNYNFMILAQVSEQKIKEIAQDNNNIIVFTDLGSGSFSVIRRYLSEHTVIILDHHEPDVKDRELLQTGVYAHVNPHIVGIDGTKEISGSGVVYYFTNQLTYNKDMSPIALVGAIGDGQDRDEFMHLNQKILADAKELGLVEVKKDFAFFGLQTRHLFKLLQYTTDPYIPGVSGNESGAVQLLKDLDIPLRQGTIFTKLHDLTHQQRKRLETEIVRRRKDEKYPEDIFANSYILTNETEGTPFKDAKEFSTLLNSAGRLESSELGIYACLGDEVAKKKAIAKLQSYKKRIVGALKWYKSPEGKGSIQRGKNYVIIHAKKSVPSTIIGTLASIISKSGTLKPRTFVLSLAQVDKEISKVSLRVAGQKSHKDIDLAKIISDVVAQVGGEAGGHRAASGAIIPISSENHFIDACKNEFLKFK